MFGNILKSLLLHFFLKQQIFSCSFSIRICIRPLGKAEQGRIYVGAGPPDSLVAPRFKS